ETLKRPHSMCGPSNLFNIVFAAKGAQHVVCHNKISHTRPFKLLTIEITKTYRRFFYFGGNKGNTKAFMWFLSHHSVQFIFLVRDAHLCTVDFTAKTFLVNKKPNCDHGT